MCGSLLPPLGEETLWRLQAVFRTKPLWNLLFVRNSLSEMKFRTQYFHYQRRWALLDGG
jgi:hypothetical protein